MPQEEKDINFKDLLIPLTNKKAFLWIILIGFIVYFNMLFNGFVWDDNFQIVNNLAVHGGNFIYYFNHTIGPYYRPIMFVVYTFLFQFFGINPFPFHLTQLFIHIINTILIFWLFKYFSRKNILPFVFAIIFLIHPINAEPVEYIANLQDVLFVFFGLISLILNVKRPFGKYTNYFLVITILLSLFSKETGILFIAVNLLYIFIFRNKNKVIDSILICSGAVIYLLTRFILVGFINPDNFNFVPINTIMSLPLAERILSLPKIILFYITTFLFPFDLTAKYWYVRNILKYDFLIPLILDIIIFTFFVLTGTFLSKKHNDSAKLYWFFFSWFCFGILLHLQVLPLDKTAADRWFYFPIIGILGLTLILTKSINVKKTFYKIVLIFFAIIILTFYSIRTIIRNSNWKNDLTLFNHDITSMEDVSDVQYNYGTALYDAGKYKEAENHLQKSTVLQPNAFQAWHNLGNTYIQLGQFNKAKICYQKEIKLNHATSSTYFSLSYISLVQGDPNEGKNLALYALKKWPNDPFLWRILGLNYYKLSNKVIAMNDFERSYSIRPMPVTQYYITQLQQNLPIIIKEL